MVTKVEKLEVESILSFGSQQCIEGFSNYNLFIGRNGTGKTNALRLLRLLDVKWVQLSRMTRLTQSPSGTQLLAKIPSSVAFLSDDYDKKLKHIGPSTSKPQSMYRLSMIKTHSATTDFLEKHEIHFMEDLNGHVWHLSGDIHDYKSKVEYIGKSQINSLILNDLVKQLGGQYGSGIKTLNFGIFYIFGEHFTFYPNGGFYQSRTQAGGAAWYDMQALPSGVNQIACLLCKFISSSAEVILIDEPELHVEPRVLRKLFEFIIWNVAYKSSEKTIQEQDVVSKVQSVFNNAISDFNPDPQSNKPNPEMSYRNRTQIFAATHSSVLINQFVDLRESASIYEFGTRECWFSDSQGSLESSVRKIDSMPESILDGLGCKGSDLLQCNGVVWVEGPSDIVYIAKWLEIYAAENALTPLEQGKDFEFQMYGGSILDRIDLSPESKHEDELKKLVTMFSFSKNSYVVIDSDAEKHLDGKIRDKSSFAKAKIYIKTEIESLNADHFNVGIWFDQENIDIVTIENYLDKASLDSVKSWYTKTSRAQKIVAQWSDSKKMADFRSELTTEIQRLYAAIFEWSR